MQSITTKYLPITGRIKATASGGSVVTLYNHTLTTPENHRFAAITLANKLGWHATFVEGGTTTGYVFVDVSGERFTV